MKQRKIPAPSKAAKVTKVSNLNSTFDSGFFRMTNNKKMANTLQKFFAEQDDTQKRPDTLTSFSLPHFRRLQHSVHELQRDFSQTADLDQPPLQPVQQPSRTALGSQARKKTIQTFDDWYLMPEQPVLRDRQPLRLAVKKCSLLRLKVYNHLQSLPLRVEVKADGRSYIELFLGLNRHPTRKEHLLKSASCHLVLDSHYQAELLSDHSVRLLAYFYRDDDVTISAIFKLAVPEPDSDLLHWTEKLYDYSSYFNIKLNKPRARASSVQPVASKVRKGSDAASSGRSRVNSSLARPESPGRVGEALMAITNNKVTEANVSQTTVTANNPTAPELAMVQPAERYGASTRLFFKLSKQVHRRDDKLALHTQEVLQRKESQTVERKQQILKTIDFKMQKVQKRSAEAKLCLRILVLRSALRAWVQVLVFCRVLLHLQGVLYKRRRIQYTLNQMQICLIFLCRLRVAARRRIPIRALNLKSQVKTVLNLQAILSHKKALKFCHFNVRQLFKQILRTTKLRQSFYHVLMQITEIKRRSVRYLRIKQNMRKEFCRRLHATKQLILDHGAEVLPQYYDLTASFEKPFFEVFFTIRINEEITHNILQMGDYSPSRARRMTYDQQQMHKALNRLVSGANVEERVSKLAKVEYYETALSNFELRRAFYDNLLKELHEQRDMAMKASNNMKSRRAIKSPEKAESERFKFETTLMQVLDPTRVRAVPLKLEGSFYLCLLLTASEGKMNSSAKKLRRLKPMISQMGDDFD